MNQKNYEVITYIKTIMDGLVSDLYDDEDNFNNRDKTSNQRICTKAGFKQYIKDVVQDQW